MADGGLRDRLIHESLLQNIKGHLATLGWFDAGREHSPITVIDEYPEEDSGEVAFNTLAISMGDAAGVPTELGNKAEDHEIAMFTDFFAESDSVGRHLNGDIYAYLRANPIQNIYDYTQVGDPIAFTVEIDEDIDKRKPDRAVQKWQKHWYVCSFIAIDYGRPHV